MLRVKLHSGTVAALEETGWKPESMPGAGVVNLVHGESKLDWVTV